jgi:hypothetical protein
MKLESDYNEGDLVYLIAFDTLHRMKIEKVTITENLVFEYHFSHLGYEKKIKKRACSLYRDLRDIPIYNNEGNFYGQ